MVKKKKQVEDTKVSLIQSDAHPLQTVYMLLAMVGVLKNREDLHLGYRDGKSRVSIALPGIKYAIAFEGDDASVLQDKGWHIEHIAYSDVEAFSRVFFSVDAARIAAVYAKADPNVKTTSKPEEKLFTEIQRRMLPVPDRNYKFFRDNGTELTTPDFTWVDERIAFFMDGAYWHSVKDDQEIINAIQKSKKVGSDIVAKRKDKVRNDGAIRSELASRGWLVLSCTDDDIVEDAGVHRVVDQIEKALQQSASVRSIEKPASSESDSLVDDLLG